MRLENLKRDNNLNNEQTIKTAKETRSSQLRDLVIQNNIPLVMSLVNKWINRGSISPREDLLSIGMVGLVKAYDAFDPNKMIKFSTYLGKVVWKEFMANASYQQMKCRSLYSAVSMEESYYKNRKSNEDKMVSDLICEDEEIDSFENIDNQIFEKELTQVINDVLVGNEHTVAIKHLIEGKSFSEIANEMKISRQGAHQIHKRYIPKLSFLAV